MLPLMYATPYMNYPQLNLQQYYMIPQTYAQPIKETCDQACQFPEPLEPLQVNKEETIEQELIVLLKYLSKNISLLKDAAFDEFCSENLKALIQLHKDIPQVIKRRYIQVNKTKEEMTKFIIRRCFLFIKSQIDYEEQEGIAAEERDRLFYHAFFSGDQEFMDSMKNETIDDMIPFRKDSKMKTMNDAYLKRLFESKRFSNYFTKFLGISDNYVAQFKEICVHENEEKIENMTNQMIKIIFTRDYGVLWLLNQKIKTYRRFPWKDHELVKCEERAKDLLQRYNSKCNKTNSKFLSKQDSHTFDILEKTSESIQ